MAAFEFFIRVAHRSLPLTDVCWIEGRNPTQFNGTPMGRIYVEGTSPPAFEELINVPGNPTWFRLSKSFASGLSGWYVYEYSDSNGIKQLGRLKKYTDSIHPCYTQPVSYNFLRTASGLSQGFGLSDTGGSLPSQPTKLTINNGITWKSGATNLVSTVSWSNAEIDALSATYRTGDYINNADSQRVDTASTSYTVINFTDPSSFPPGSLPPPFDSGGTFTAVFLNTTVGLAVSQHLNFSSNPGYVSGPIVHIGVLSGDPYVIIQHSYAGNPPGVTAFKTSTTICVDNYSKDIFIGEASAVPLSAGYTKIDVTSTGGSDGEIFVDASGGSGNYSYEWDDGPTTQNRSNLIAGFYSVIITDIVTFETVQLDITILEPEPVLKVGTFLYVPPLNSLQFSEDVDIDNCGTFFNQDNLLLIKQKFGAYQIDNYFQPVAKCDLNITQFKSDFPSHSMVLYEHCSDELVKIFNIELKEENLNQVEDHNIIIRPHSANINQSRVYFNSGELPLPLKALNVFEVLNNLDGYNGNYTIIDIIFDSLLGYHYIIINLAYDSINTISPAVGRFIRSTKSFNVYESGIDLLDIDNGYYYLKLVATDDVGNQKSWTSEPIDLKVEHENTNLVEYRNFDNAFDMTYTTGYIGRIRIPSVMVKRLPGGERTVSRNSDFSLVKVSAKKIRGFLFEVIKVPPYIHEKLSCIFDHDFFMVNKVQYQSSEAYADPDYVDRAVLSSSSIKLEQAGWFDKYNSDDIGTVEGGGFIITETGFIKR